MLYEKLPQPADGQSKPVIPSFGVPGKDDALTVYPNPNSGGFEINPDNKLFMRELVRQFVRQLY